MILLRKWLTPRRISCLLGDHYWTHIEVVDETWTKVTGLTVWCPVCYAYKELRNEFDQYRVNRNKMRLEHDRRYKNKSEEQIKALNEKRRHIAELVDKQWTYGEIGRVYDVSRQRIFQFCRNQGIKKLSPSETLDNVLDKQYTE